MVDCVRIWMRLYKQKARLRVGELRAVEAAKATAMAIFVMLESVTVPFLATFSICTLCTIHQPPHRRRLSQMDCWWLELCPNEQQPTTTYHSQSQQRSRTTLLVVAICLQGHSSGWVGCDCEQTYGDTTIPASNRSSSAILLAGPSSSSFFYSIMSISMRTQCRVKLLYLHNKRDLGSGWKRGRSRSVKTTMKIHYYYCYYAK